MPFTVIGPSEGRVRLVLVLAGSQAKVNVLYAGRTRISYGVHQRSIRGSDPRMKRERRFDGVERLEELSVFGKSEKSLARMYRT